MQTDVLIATTFNPAKPLNEQFAFPTPKSQQRDFENKFQTIQLIFRNEMDLLRATKKEIEPKLEEWNKKLEQEESFNTETRTEMKNAFLKICDARDISKDLRDNILLSEIQYFKTSSNDCIQLLTEELGKMREEVSELSRKIKNMRNELFKTVVTSLDQLNNTTRLLPWPLLKKTDPYSLYERKKTLPIAQKQNLLTYVTNYTERYNLASRSFNAVIEKAQQVVKEALKEKEKAENSIEEKKAKERKIVQILRPLCQMGKRTEELILALEKTYQFFWDRPLPTYNAKDINFDIINSQQKHIGGFLETAKKQLATLQKNITNVTYWGTQSLNTYNGQSWLSFLPSFSSDPYELRAKAKEQEELSISLTEEKKEDEEEKIEQHTSEKFLKNWSKKK